MTKSERYYIAFAAGYLSADEDPRVREVHEGLKAMLWNPQYAVEPPRGWRALFWWWR